MSSRVPAPPRLRWLLLAITAAGCARDERDGDLQAWQGSSLGSIGSGPAGGDDGGDDDDDDASSSGSDGGSTGAASSAPASDGGSDPGSGGGGDDSSGGVADTGSGDPVLDACLDIAVDACEMCACNLCLDPLYACQQDPGCVAMRDCAQQAGCAGTDCLEPCGAVIDMYGGVFGSSATLAVALSDCLAGACPVCF